MSKPKNGLRSLTTETCRELTGLISDYLRNRLDPGLRREFERHLRICPDCVNFLRNYKKTIDATGALDPIMMPTNVRDNLLTFLRKKIQKAAAFLIYVASQFFA